jgi:hypothetical protein
LIVPQVVRQAPLHYVDGAGMAFHTIFFGHVKKDVFIPDQWAGRWGVEGLLQGSPGSFADRAPLFFQKQLYNPHLIDGGKEDVGQDGQTPVIQRIEGGRQEYLRRRLKQGIGGRRLTLFSYAFFVFTDASPQFRFSPIIQAGRQVVKSRRIVPVLVFPLTAFFWIQSSHRLGWKAADEADASDG